MNKSLLSAFVLILFTLFVQAQVKPIKLRKGIILDSLQVRDTLPDTFALYIPSAYKTSEAWPVIFVMDMTGDGAEAIRKFRSASEKQRYLLAASNSLNDTLSISDNVEVIRRLMTTMAAMFAIPKGRIYAAGFGNGGKMAGIIPYWVKGVEAVISIGDPINNRLFIELADNSMQKIARPFRSIGVVGREDYHYPIMLKAKRQLDDLNVPYDLLVHDGGDEIQNPGLVERAVRRLTIGAMRKGLIEKDTNIVVQSFETEYADFRQLMEGKRYPEAEAVLNSIIANYQTLISTDTLIKAKRNLRRIKEFKVQRRELKNLMFQEELKQGDYEYNLLQDLDALNYNNLGWWNYQMKKLKEYERKPGLREKQMGKRLISFLNAMVEDNIRIEQARPSVDEEAVSLLWMIKTITDPTDFSYYLKIISDSAKYEDYGTAIFYLEELLKQGFTDKEALYALENTALLRIMPEFNKLVEKYLNEARYKLNEE
jgi:hypothetical protein